MRVEAPDRPPAPRRHPKHLPAGHSPLSRIVPPSLTGETVVCFATGPSLTPEVVETIRPYHEAGIVKAAGLNDAYRAVDYLDVFYACDLKWWEIHTDAAFALKQPRHLMEIDAEMWGNNTAAKLLKKYPHINIVHGHGKQGFSEQRIKIHWGNNSGFQLLNLVFLMGAERMVLVGYNMNTPQGKEPHFFGKHPDGLGGQNGNQYRGFVQQYQRIQGRIKKMIVNATPDTALDCFEHVDLAEYLEGLKK